MQNFPIDELKAWFLEVKRDFPWRENPSPYEVWVSEIMLQQTQASVVIPYFLHWMREFPDIESLAAAPIEKVIKAWEGLGYYSRARNMHEGAKYIVECFGGRVPGKEEELKKIKGLGPYTIGAILSFAFHKKKAAVDANVHRVISRYFLSEKRVPELTEGILPDREPHVVMEALIELGALVCKKRPECFVCPLKEKCLARAKEMTEMIPTPKDKKKTIVLLRHIAILRFDKHVLVRKEKRGKVMADLYEFPYFEQKIDQSQLFGLNVVYGGDLPKVTHTFTKYRAHLYPSIWQVKAGEPVDGYEWILWDELKKLPFSSGHRKILNSMEV